MSKVKNISGFPEWLPEEKLLEERIIDQIRSIYKSFGFTPIETPAVEFKSTLSSKGVIDKEIYILRRALKDPNEVDSEELALHFDLTVPFARYTAQHLNDLVFPFKRYQLQKVWRGERPQRGRFREFYQFDIDIVARDVLPISCDAEILTAVHAVFSNLQIGSFLIKINNRKILLGLYESLGLSAAQQKKVLTIVDKLDKIGIAGIEKELSNEPEISGESIDRIISYTHLRMPLSDAKEVLGKIECTNETFLEGLTEIDTLASLLPLDRMQFDLSLARGLDYYTGTIYEVTLPEHPEFGSVSSGGRYEDLAGQFTNQKLPGVGGSVGITRLMGLILEKDLLEKGRACPTDVLVTVYAEEQRPFCFEVAAALRQKGFATEVFPSTPKLGKQIEYADKKGIPLVVFIQSEPLLIKTKKLSTKEEKEYSSLDEFLTAGF